ncbi:LysR family transcriptional regulator [Providencia alcalifaciens]|uniref:LysR family transcriptional regulator n=1 Tax=Providencia alcalifaciens TaxID=126385 RepID=UPI002B05FD6F|nr:LysR family transcriptional regulator [Providencia alcalifaciens]
MLDKMEYFCAVVRLGSVSQASAEQRISVSTGSRWIAELEAKLGMTLLHRTTRKVIPSEAGLSVYEHFTPVLKAGNIAIDAVRRGEENLCGQIKISSTPLFARNVLPHIIATYLQRYPEMRFKVVINPFQADVVDEYDFSIRAIASHIGKPGVPSGDTCLRLHSEPLVVIATQHYLDTRHEIHSPDDLAHHRCLFASSLVGGDRWEFQRGEKYVFIKITDSVQCDDSEVLHTMALAHAGIACLPRRLVQPDIDNGRLIALLPNDITSTFDICLYYRKYAFMPKRLMHFKAYLEHYCRQPENMAKLFNVPSRRNAALHSVEEKQ